MEPASGNVFEVKKLDKKALEGLDARTKSTKVPDEDMEELVEGPPSDNETATSTKRSQSKPEHGRGPLREAKQAKKALIHKGIVTKEEAERLSPLEVLDMVKNYRKGSSMLSDVLLQQLEENKKEDLLAKPFGEHTETPDMKVPEITDEQVREADKVLLATREKCPFCKKVLDELRITTLHHRVYMKEHLQSSYLLGDPTSMSAKDVKSPLLRVRRFFWGGLKELSLQNALEYWGDVERLPTLVKSMHQERPMQVKFGKSDKAKTHAFPKEEVVKYHFAWVSYAPTSGKYKNAT